jgi:iron complex outermembrane receptor protein
MNKFWPQRIVRSAIISRASAVALFCAAFANAQTVGFDLPAQDAATAIPEFARQAGIQIIAPLDNLKGIKTHGILGKMDVHEALRRLLEGTGLVVVSDDGHTISLKTPTAPTADVIRVPSSVGGQSDALEEILVTAQKRTERIQDVPIPVTVLNANTLAENGQDRLRDYFDTVPGLNINPDFVATENVTIRGITTGGLTTPTVGTVIDGVQVGGGYRMTDLDPGDLARIEVLRGPQGTLYGANSMGGLLNFVTQDPSTSGYSGRLEGGASGVSHGTQPGYTFRGSVNVPVNDTFAFRASAFGREDPGYIDNPIYHLQSVNSVASEGARLSAMWQPSDTFSFKISGLYNDVRTNGLDEVVVAPGLGPLHQNYLAGSGYTDTAIQAYSAIIKAKLGVVDVDSITGYNVNRVSDGLDATNTFGSGVMKAFGVPAVPYLENSLDRKVSQELRLSTSIEKRLDILLGGFYTHDDLPSSFDFLGEDPLTGRIAGSYYASGPSGPSSKYDETAVFGDFTYHFTDTIDIQVGGRESHIKVTSGATLQSGPLFTSGSVYTPAYAATANAFTYLVTPRWKITPDVMVYARLASGYRPGGPNIPGGGVPLQYSPDKTKNYEIGTKADFLDHKVSIDVSAYYIDWNDLQIQLRAPVTTLVYTGNASEAKSEGVEASIATHPLTGLTLSGWFAYDDAVLTKPFPDSSPSYGMVGDRLPLSSRYSSDLSGEYQFPLRPDVTGFVGGDLAYVGDRIGVFGPKSAPERQYFPDYAKLNFRVGFKYQTWKANLYVNNAADRRALVDGGIGYFNPQARLYITPRTIGVDFVKTF